MSREFGDRCIGDCLGYGDRCDGQGGRQIGDEILAAYRLKNRQRSGQERSNAVPGTPGPCLLAYILLAFHRPNDISS